MKRPLYIKIYDHFKSLIEDKKLLPGDEIDSEKDLMEKYNCSRDTVRKATTLLEQHSYIKKSRGKPSVVIENDHYNFPAANIKSFKELSSDSKFSTSTKLVNLTLDDKDEYPFLREMKSDKVYRIARVREIDNQAIIYDVDYLDADLVPNMTEQIAEDSIYEYIEGVLDIQIAYSEKNITVRHAPNKILDSMDLLKDDLVVLVKSKTYTDNNEFFQYTRSFHRADKFSFNTYALRK